ncbi:uncharacterized protein ISCGN_007286 [Ixodes scapularis]
MLDALKRRAFSIAVDGTSNRDSQLYPIVATYYVEETRKVESRLLCLETIEGEASGRKIGNLILDVLKSRDLPIANCLAMSADNANVMIGKKNGVAAVLERGSAKFDCSWLSVPSDQLSRPERSARTEARCFWSPTRSHQLHRLPRPLHRLPRPPLHRLPRPLQRLSRPQHRLPRPLHRLQAPKTPAQAPKTPAQLPKTRVQISRTAAQIPKVAGHEGKESADGAGDGHSLKRKGVNPMPHAKKLRQPPQESGEASIMSCEKRLVYFLSSELNRAYCLFLVNVIPLFDKTNCLLQVQAPQIHILRGLLNQLLEDLLTRFVRPDVLKGWHSLLTLAYGAVENQREDKDLVIGSMTYSVVERLKPNEREQFFSAVRLYFATVCDYIRNKFPLENVDFRMAEVAQLQSLDTSSFSSIRHFVTAFPALLPQQSNESKDEAMDALEVEFANLQAYNNLSLAILNEPRSDVQWAQVGDIRSVDGTLKFRRIAVFMLGILTISHSNAECERLFSTVNKTRTEFRSSVSDRTLGNLLMVKGHQNGACFEQVYSENFLKQAKSATAKSLKK